MSVSTTDAESDSRPDSVMTRLVDDPHFLETLRETMSEGAEEPVQKALERYMKYWD